MNRYARQERVLGSAAQARLARAVVRVQSTSDAAASVEARYLAGAGVSGLSATSAEAVEDAKALNGAVAFYPAEPAEGAADEPPWVTGLAPAAADFVRGALRALATMRAASR